jgi:hypothetical protein
MISAAGATPWEDSAWTILEIIDAGDGTDVPAAGDTTSTGGLRLRCGRSFKIRSGRGPPGSPNRSRGR